MPDFCGFYAILPVFRHKKLPCALKKLYQWYREVMVPMKVTNPNLFIAPNYLKVIVSISD